MGISSVKMVLIIVSCVWLTSIDIAAQEVYANVADLSIAVQFEHRHHQSTLFPVYLQATLVKFVRRLRLGPDKMRVGTVEFNGTVSENERKIELTSGTSVENVENVLMNNMKYNEHGRMTASDKELTEMGRHVRDHAYSHQSGSSERKDTQPPHLVVLFISQTNFSATTGTAANVVLSSNGSADFVIFVAISTNRQWIDGIGFARGQKFDVTAATPAEMARRMVNLVENVLDGCWKREMQNECSYGKDERCVAGISCQTPTGTPVCVKACQETAVPCPNGIQACEEMCARHSTWAPCHTTKCGEKGVSMRTVDKKIKETTFCPAKSITCHVQCEKNNELLMCVIALAVVLIILIIVIVGAYFYGTSVKKEIIKTTSSNRNLRNTG